MYAIQCRDLIFQDRGVVIFSISNQVWARVEECAFSVVNFRIRQQSVLIQYLPLLEEANNKQNALTLGTLVHFRGRGL
jgi:hypothetical protein